MKLYDTLEKKERLFKPLYDKTVKLYACGPTVYFYAHIGNMRTYISIDVLKRTLIHDKYKVKHVMNITDVGHNIGDGDVGEDKIKEEAKKEHRTAEEIIKFYTDSFMNDLKKLNIIKPDIISRASSNVEDMLKLIEILDEKGYLYRTNTGVYFDTSKVNEYGTLSGSSFEKLNKELKAGARVERPEGLKNITDFAVWRFSKPEEKEMVWDTKFGRGFPGWHIECSTMVMKFLGEQIDIHCGGADHISIHHSNEIAQSEAATGKKFVKYWFHGAFLIVDGKKMSKSLRNVYTIEDLEKKKFMPLSFRYLVLTVHYRNILNFTLDVLKSADDSLKALYVFISKTSAVKDGTGIDEEFIRVINSKRDEFFEKAYDDINIPIAITKMYEFINIVKKKALTKNEADYVIKIMLDFDEILGLDFNMHLNSEIPKEASKLIEEREIIRKARDFEKADRIREEIKKKYKIILEDTPEGTVWYKSSELY